MLPYFPRIHHSGWICLFDLVQSLCHMHFLIQPSHLSKLQRAGTWSTLALDPPEAGFVSSPWGDNIDCTQMWVYTAVQKIKIVLRPLPLLKCVAILKNSAAVSSVFISSSYFYCCCNKIPFFFIPHPTETFSDMWLLDLAISVGRIINTLVVQCTGFQGSRMLNNHKFETLWVLFKSHLCENPI